MRRSLRMRTYLSSKLYHTAFAKTARAMVKHIDDFEFDEALELLDALREAILA